MYRLTHFLPQKALGAVYLSNLFLGLHYFLTLYVNSSFLENHFSQKLISISYALGALLNIGLLFLAPKILLRFSNKTLALTLAAGEFVSVYLISIASGGASLFILFILHQALAPMILYCLDLFLESQITDERATGRARSIFLTIQTLTLIMSLLFVSKFVNDNNFSFAYILSALSLIPFAAITAFKLHNINYRGRHISLQRSVKFLKENVDTVRIIVAQFLLQFFYAWMVIYLPLALRTEAGFEWNQIGIILLIMIVPFALIEIPAGILADKKYGEKEMLGLGFSVMAIFTMFIPFLPLSSFILWSAVLFATRVGASLVEVGSETYFFKKVREKNSDIISCFRMTRPLAFVLAPLIAFPIMLNLSYSRSFAFLSVITLLGLFFLPKRDTR